jgi:hypothetical protein
VVDFEPPRREDAKEEKGLQERAANSSSIYLSFFLGALAVQIHFSL